MKQIDDLVSPEAKQIIQGIIFGAKIADFAEETNNLPLLAAIDEESPEQIASIIPEIDNPVLKSIAKMILSKAEDLSDLFGEGKGSFFIDKVFDQYAIILLKKFLATQ